MSKTKKRGTAIAVAGAVAAVAIGGGVAWAAFTQQSESTAVAAGADTFEVVTVSGTVADDSLYPNQATDVTLTVSNVNDVPIKATRVEFVPLTDGDITNIPNGSRTYCRGKVTLVTRAVDVPISAGTAGNPATGTITLEDGLRLAKDTDNSCQGMRIAAKWKVTTETAA
ncbi:hypothetical protein [Catenuloplanes atrovinosus]|uniref:DUF4352 domain-containing protein n=1 Tax=Catenuloplanes atrovinosus TaxID=137266 RepID=A0AAE3YUN7_9ACTN|nr:hypothetical protein [Catenuloplanes atrovinosus]MDR7280234.1 hypothetical protein [Catenuloplanes atrovinosus]